jgi:hypothetical protein
MPTKLIAVTLALAAGLGTRAAAEPEIVTADIVAADRDIASAVARAHEDGQRIAYHAALTTIAERDVVSAQLLVSVMRERWDLALRRHDPVAAGMWATAHANARSQEEEASRRFASEQAERDAAMDAFRRDAAELRQATARARRARELARTRA